MPNKEFFINTGNYVGRNDKTIPKEISDYFYRDLYAVNICILDFICQRWDEFNGKMIVDNGSGFGLLSIYLNKIGVECWNYDEFTQMKDIGFNEFLYERTGIGIKRPVDKLPDSAFALTSSSIWVTNPKYNEMEIKYYMIDTPFVTKNCVLDYSGYKLIDTYPGNMEVYERD